MATLTWRVLLLLVACVLAALDVTEERPASRLHAADADADADADTRLLRQLHALEEMLYARLHAEAEQSAEPDEGELLRGLQELQFEKRGTALRGNPW